MIRGAGAKQRLAGAAFTIGALAAGSACAQNYPSKPIRVFTTPAGSGSDNSARLITPVAAALLGQPMVIENRAAGVIPGQEVAKALPDGYTLLYSASSLWLGPYLRKDTPYDPARDFQPITQATRQSALLVVPLTVPVNSVKELIALAKARPGELNYATATLGSLNHLGAELFNSMAGIKVQRVDYKGGAQMVQDLVAGRVQIMFGTFALVSGQVKAGKLRALGVSSPQPSELAPGVPPIASVGLPGYKAEANAGFFAPARTPRPVVERLQRDIAKALFMPEVKDKLFATGVEAVGNTPEQFGALVRDEMTVLGKLIKDLGITED